MLVAILPALSTPTRTSARRAPSVIPHPTVWSGFLRIRRDPWTPVGVYVAIYRSVHDFANVRVWVIEIVAICYLLLPLLTGWTLGWGVKKGKRWALLAAGHSREPRAWDRLWGSERNYLVLVQMKSGAFLGGLFEGEKNGLSSYASGFDGGKDLYLSRLLVGLRDAVLQQPEWLVVGGQRDRHERQRFSRLVNAGAGTMF